MSIALLYSPFAWKTIASEFVILEEPMRMPSHVLSGWLVIKTISFVWLSYCASMVYSFPVMIAFICYASSRLVQSFVNFYMSCKV